MAENTAYPTADHVAAGSEQAEPAEETEETTEDENTEEVPGA